jgi:hypothetical protein
LNENKSTKEVLEPLERSICSFNKAVVKLKCLLVPVVWNCHKSQGSQWPNCFVMLPNEAERMIDQTLLYTASTRSSERLVLMGNERIIEKAIMVGYKALNRKTLLKERICSACELK